LAESYGAVRYGSAHPSSETADEAWQQVDALRRALDASDTWWSRLRARVDPGTLRRRERDLARASTSSAPISDD
jgi:hypothetical protein